MTSARTWPEAVACNENASTSLAAGTRLPRSALEPSIRDLPLSTRLPRSALERSVRDLPLGSAPLGNVLRRLQRGEPLIVTAIGMSNTFEFGGCYGDQGCGALYEMRKQEGKKGTDPSHGWGVAFMTWLNRTWPHPGHQFFNRAAGASNPTLATHCLASHLAPGTNMLIVDFDLSDWKAAQQVRCCAPSDPRLRAPQRPSCTLQHQLRLSSGVARAERRTDAAPAADGLPQPA